MTEREAIYRLRCDLMQAEVLLSEIDRKPARVERWMERFDKTLDSTTDFRPTLEELKDWEANGRQWTKG